MKKTIFLWWTLLLCGVVSIQAQVKDAATVYSEFAHWVDVIKAAEPQSEEYEQAAQAMLQLFPQLHYHAAKYSQQKQLGNAMSFAKAYVDLAMMPQFEAMHLEKNETYPTMTYFLASNYYNRKDYANSITYLQRYIDLNEPKSRAVVYLFLAKSYENIGDTDNELKVLMRAMEEYPMTMDFLSMTINTCMTNGWYGDAYPFIEKALQLKPGDERLMTIRDQCRAGLQRPAEEAPARPEALVAISPTPPKPEQLSEYRMFVQKYVEKAVQIWQEKDPFETIDEYKARVTEQTRNAMVAELMADAKKQYLAKQVKKIDRNDFELMPYDAENKVFLIRSKYGDLVLPVPRENNEARNFAKTWNDALIANPELDIAGDEVVIRSIDFVTRDGNIYSYSNNDVATYSQTEIAMQFDQIDYSQLGGGSAKKNNVKIEKNAVVVGNSDVDINIPQAKNLHSNTFAFLVGNEHYQQIAPVPFAIHDAQIMKQYCQKALGVPETNIRLYEDATFGKILSCMREIRNIADAYNGNIDIIFYYAGHGVPDEASKSAYLLPIDADATQTETCYPVGRLYHELGQLGAKSVVVFMDACFSGSQRGEGMLASARGVALKAKADAPQGRMVTFSAATGEETAYPYDEQQHGMFTYYLLKCIQENKGRMTLGDLADYVQTQVKQRSVVINHKSQTPTVNASEEAKDWRKWSWK